MESVGPPMARALRNFFVAAPSRQVDCWRAGWWIIRFRAPDGLPPSRGACEASVSQDGYNAWTRGHPSRRAQGHAPQSLTGNAAHGIGRHSGMVRSTRPGISRFSDVQLHIGVRCFASPRNDCLRGLFAGCISNQTLRIRFRGWLPLNAIVPVFPSSSRSALRSAERQVQGK